MPLVFPGSTRKKSESPPDPFELEFRDGKRSVAPYLCDLMSGLDTVRFTYAQAVEEVNKNLLRNHANDAMRQILSRVER